MIEFIYTFFVILFASFVHGGVGFGVALIAVALMSLYLLPQESVPLMSLLAGTLNFTMLMRYRQAFNWRATIRLTLGALAGVPIGVFLLRQLDGDLVIKLLGVIVLGYGVYALLNLQLPELKRPFYGYIFGFFGGILSGAYNTGGPPAIVYGSCRRWPPAMFKGNLQGYFLINGSLVMLTHLLMGNYTPIVLQRFLYAVPAVFLGLGLGFTLDGRIDPVLFRKLVLRLLLVLGAALLF